MERSLTKWAGVLGLVCTLAATQQASAADGDLELGPGDETRTREMIFVPRLGGAISIGADVAYRFELGNDDALPASTVGANLGYRHFFDWHGRLSARAYLAGRYGGLANSAIDGEIGQLGGGLSLHVRGYSDTWAFFGSGLYVEFLGTHWNAPAEFGTRRVDERGWQLSFGLQTDFGQLVTLDPYLFAETSALMGLDYLEVGPWKSWSIDARWMVRFDWAWRPSGHSAE